MENFKFMLFSIFILVILGFAGYWAFSTIESGSTHVDNQKQKELEQKNEELSKEITQLKKEINILELEKEEQSQKNEEVLSDKVVEVPSITKTTSTKTTTFKYQSLINDLQKMVNENVFLKKKSKGVMVGTIQKFLNIYNNTSNKIDNDYGLSTETAVKNFQKAEKLTADGEAGSSTFLKMISWLKSK